MREQWRQGDVLFEPIADSVQDLVPRPGGILYTGEATGHAHRLEDPDAAEVLVPAPGDQWGIFLRVSAPGATIVHDEHRPLRLAAGFYRVWRQREYAPHGTRGVAD